METHMETKSATNIFVKRMKCGFVPAEAKMWVERTLAMLYLERAAAKVNPPNKSMMTLDHIDDKMNWEDSRAAMGWEVTGSLMTGNTTMSRGIIREVTKRGIVSVAHSRDA